MHPGGTVPPFKMHPGGTLNFLNYFFELEFGLRSKNKLPLVASVFEFEPCKSYFPTPSPFSSWSRSDVCLYAYPGRTVPTSQMHPVCWNRPLIKYNQNKNIFSNVWGRNGKRRRHVKIVCENFWKLWKLLDYGRLFTGIVKISSQISNVCLWMSISTIILGIWGYSDIFIYRNFYCLQNASAVG